MISLTGPSLIEMGPVLFDAVEFPSDLISDFPQAGTITGSIGPALTSPAIGVRGRFPFFRDRLSSDIREGIAISDRRAAEGSHEQQRDIVRLAAIR
ncbi:hypothetical protein EN784_42730 [bacterium M00.F.Ca.ET.141.01.1.1]|nr:hypothetical protein EN784_42730 [bacterium M00.F.Ca.ET.141.01.1.1]